VQNVNALPEFYSDSLNSFELKKLKPSAISYSVFLI
jgi:hypothetical protein